MKKNFIYLLAVTLFMGLFAACSQEETAESPTGKGKRVSISAQLPVEFAQTRALPEATGHQLRCILEVWSQGETPELIYRNEQLGADATNDKISFEFSLEAGNYDCLMWADFIATDATLANGRYTDKYYNTADLKKVTLKDASKLYNSDACDAFFASQVLEKTDLQEMQTFDATLQRPFAKLIVSEKNTKSFGICKKVSVSHKVAESFNVAEGTASSETVTATLTDAAPIGAGETDLRLFSCYAFADEDGALKEISLSFKDENDSELRSTAIPAGVAFQRNHCTKAKGHLVAEATNNTTVDVGVSDGWDADVDGGDVDPVDPTPEVKIGDYYYSDGTWSSTLDANKTCVGIVFATGANYGDNAANYDGKLTDIKGYVMALKNTAEKRNEFCDKSMNGLIDFSALALDGIGYSNTKSFLAWQGYKDNADKFKSIAEFNAFSIQVPNTTSGWYIPSQKQLFDMLTKYYGYTNAKNEKENITKDDVFAAAVDAANGNIFVDAPTARYVFSNTINGGTINTVTITDGVITENKFVPISGNDGKPGAQGLIRPILTF